MSNLHGFPWIPQLGQRIPQLGQNYRCMITLVWKKGMTLARLVTSAQIHCQTKLNVNRRTYPENVF